MFQTKSLLFQFIHFRGTKRLFPISRIDCCLENRFQITTEKKERKGRTFDGIKLWNSLPLDLKEANNKIYFKNKMKHFLLECPT